MWSSGYILWNQHCLYSSAPWAQSGAELCLCLCLSPQILKSPGTLLVRCTFVFFAGQNIRILHLFFSGAVQKFKSTKYSPEFESSFSLYSCISNYYLIPFVATHGTSNDGNSIWYIWITQSAKIQIWRLLWCAGLGHVSYTLFNKLTQCARSPPICSIFWWN